MQSSERRTGYTRIAVLLHWLLAAALLCQLVLGWWMIGLPEEGGVQRGWFNWHKSIGIVIGIVVLLRLSWRVAHPAPGLDLLPAWQQRAAQLNHALLYACMLVLPLSGYLGSSFSGYPVRFFGVVLPSWAQAWPAAKQFMSGLHYATVWFFMALVAMHVAAALWHAWRRDGVAGRMRWPTAAEG
jgi:cytochrome b561